MSSNKSFVPPTYQNFGKSAKDLFKKKFDFDHVVKSVNKTDAGLTLETGGNVSAGFKGFIKSKYVNSDFGEVESEVYTDAASESKAILRLKKLAKGLNLALQYSAPVATKNGVKSAFGSLDAEYSQDYVASKFVAKTDLTNSSLDVSAAVGADGLSVGGQAVLDVSKGADVTDSAIGVEYAKKDFTASVFTEKNLDVVNATYFQRLDRSTAVGAKFAFGLSGSQTRTVWAGVDHQLDADTNVKAKVELPTGLVTTAIEHKLANPRLLFAVAAEFNTKSQPLTAQKFGLGLTFGDF